DAAVRRRNVSGSASLRGGTPIRAQAASSADARTARYAVHVFRRHGLSSRARGGASAARLDRRVPRQGPPDRARRTMPRTPPLIVNRIPDSGFGIRDSGSGIRDEGFDQGVFYPSATTCTRICPRLGRSETVSMLAASAS